MTVSDIPKPRARDTAPSTRTRPPENDEDQPSCGGQDGDEERWSLTIRRQPGIGVLKGEAPGEDGTMVRASRYPLLAKGEPDVEVEYRDEERTSPTSDMRQSPCYCQVCFILSGGTPSVKAPSQAVAGMLCLPDHPALPVEKVL